MFNVIILNNQTWNQYTGLHLSLTYFDMSLEGYIKENIDKLISEAVDTIRGKKHKIRNEFFICSYLNANTDKDENFIEDLSDTF